MKRFALATFMFCATLIAIAWPHEAHASERYLGSIVSAAGADTTNGSTATAFVVPSQGGYVTLQCNATAYIAVDDLVAVTSTRGITVPTNAIFLTHLTGKPSATITVSAALVRSGVIRIAGPAAVTCNVWSRDGNE